MPERKWKISFRRQSIGKSDRKSFPSGQTKAEWRGSYDGKMCRCWHENKRTKFLRSFVEAITGLAAQTVRPYKHCRSFKTPSAVVSATKAGAKTKERKNFVLFDPFNPRPNGAFFMSGSPDAVAYSNSASEIFSFAELQAAGRAWCMSRAKA